jgi:hypothetical protein
MQKEPGYYIWTNAEAIIAFIEAKAEIPEKAIERFLEEVYNCKIANKGGELIPTGEYRSLGLRKGVVDCTVRVVQALFEIRYYMIRKGINDYTLEKGIKVKPSDIKILIDSLLRGLIAEKNDEGGWGTFYGEESRTDPTAHVLITLVRCRLSEKEYKIVIEETANYLVKELRIESEKGWGSMDASEEADPGNTSLALKALALVNPVTEQVLIDGVEYLRKCINNGEFFDIMDKLEFGKGAMGSTAEGICIPTAPRMLEALLACGVYPNDDIINKLVSYIVSKVRKEVDPEIVAKGLSEVEGWGLDNRNINTWYTSIVVYAFSDYLRYAEYAGNRVDDTERCYLATRIETLMKGTEDLENSYKKLENDFMTVSTEYNKIRQNINSLKAAKDYRKIAYIILYSAAGILGGFSILLNLYGNAINKNILVYLSYALGSGDIITLVSVIKKYLSKKIPEIVV